MYVKGRRQVTRVVDEIRVRARMDLLEPGWKREREERQSLLLLALQSVSYLGEPGVIETFFLYYNYLHMCNLFYILLLGWPVIRVEIYFHFETGFSGSK